MEELGIAGVAVVANAKAESQIRGLYLGMLACICEIGKSSGGLAIARSSNRLAVLPVTLRRGSQTNTFFVGPTTRNKAYENSIFVTVL